jgi:Mn2+/Fe2+ NRAMP family transporter
MKLLGGLSFATATAIVGGVTAAVVQFLIFAQVWRSIVVFSLSVPFAYFFTRWKLKRMNLAPDCTWTDFFVATKNRRLRQ